MKRKILSWLLVLAMVCTILPSAALAADEHPTVTSRPESASVSQPEQGEDLFLSYLEQEASEQTPSARRGVRKSPARTAGSKLTGTDRAIYDALLPEIARVAAGERASTAFELSVEQLGLTDVFTASDLGVDSILEGDAISEAAMDALSWYGDFSLFYVHNALLFDCPYELYWYDKTTGVSVDYFWYTAYYDETIGDYVLGLDGSLVLYFTVAKEFSAGDDYTVDTAIGQSIPTVLRNARAIVTEYAGASDYGKLLGYKNELCDRVSYNQEAVDTEAAYGNPWQLIWAFDDDDSTNIVCEGYSKAYQFLCDSSSFEDDILCFCATGEMNVGGEGGPHMWNVVRMGDGSRYLVDVTNCDEGSIGEPDLLFLAGYDGGEVYTGYEFDCYGEIVEYYYDDETCCLFSEEELTLSDADYAPIRITAQPQDVTTVMGAKASFTVQAEGEGLSYYWFVFKEGASDWTEWTGRTGKTASGTVNASWDGMYVCCVVVDQYGNYVESDHAYVTLAMKITSQPKSVTLPYGANASFSVTAEGSGLTYQWYFRKAGATAWSKWTGRTSATATGTVNSTWDGMQVRCVVKDANGNSVTSNTATVTLAPTLKITSQPKSATLANGANASFSVTAEGSGLTYQWYFKKAGATTWSKWSGRTSATATGTVNSTWDGMQVRCVVKDKYGSTVTSNSATVTIASAIKITAQPQSVSTLIGAKPTFTVKAEGSGLKYQWYFKKAGATAWSKWADRTEPTATGTVNSTWDGMQVRCVITDSKGNTVTSNAATITLALKITSQPQSITTSVGEKASFSVKAEGKGLTYQWYVLKTGSTKWTAWTGRTTATISGTVNSTWNGMQVRCVVKDADGHTVTSGIAKVTLK